MGDVWTRQEKRLLAAVVRGDLALRWVQLKGDGDVDVPELHQALDGLDACMLVYDLLGPPKDPGHVALLDRAQDIRRRLTGAQQSGTPPRKS